MHEDGLLISAGAGHEPVPGVRPCPEGVTVLAVHRERRRVSVLEHREDVLRRLLSLGLTPRLLRALLPEFRSTIDRIAATN